MEKTFDNFCDYLIKRKPGCNAKYIKELMEPHRNEIDKYLSDNGDFPKIQLGIHELRNYKNLLN